MSDNYMHEMERDPRYQEGLAHYQAGRWAEAIRCFEKLALAYPDNRLLADLLEQARFKVRLDADTRVRGRRWMIPWTRLIVGLVAVSALALAAVFGIQAIQERVAPAISQARIERARAQLLAEANSLLEAGKLGSAEAKFEELLAQVPDHPEALQGLEEIAVQRELLSLYEQGMAQQQAGELHQALAVFQDLLVRAPQYKDVRLQVGEIQHALKVEELFQMADQAYADERYEEALDLYEQLQSLDSTYQPNVVRERLYALYMDVGRSLVEQEPPQTDLLPAAIAYFGRALSLQPRSAEAAWEQRLAEAFLDGLVRYQEGYFDQAIISLRAVYDRRADYMGNMTLNLLYESYVRSGDQYRRENDLGFAYEQYRQAAALPVEDRTLALERLREITPFLTPTPTPTITPTPTATPLPTATRPPTAIPTPKPLAAYRNHIAFWSENEEQPGLWVMDSAFKNRTYLGDSRALRKQFDELVARQHVSPDGRYVLFVRNIGGSAQIMMERPDDPESGEVLPLQLTRLRVCYHPVWSPDGSRIAFVSEQDRTDDIWIMNADGSEQRNLTENEWEWEKHPTWSPDGSKIVFWSNREGRRQLY
ncbi:MAG: tetratricopeptide repeat protein, partial [Chloroflexi bacterium]|nr:tetratricopeptide repeat protein [Chloroflexota bacterium]